MEYSDATSLVQNLSQLVAQNEISLLGVDDEVKWLGEKLKVLNIFLQVSERGRYNCEIVEILNKIRDVAHETADVMDRVILEAAKQRSRNKVGKFFHSFHHSTERMKNIKNKIKETMDKRNRLHISSTYMASAAHLRNTGFVKEDGVVGFDNEAKIRMLVRQLIQGESPHDVISITGMDGLGKSTILAPKIYDVLARHLKPCFLYIGAFPKDMEIPARQLIQLWIAEGFIQQCGSRNMEDAADEYLEELVNQSLIQVARRRADGGIKTCRIHNLMREYCISETTQVNFLEVHLNVFTSSFSTKPRRLSIHCNTSTYISSPPCNSSFVRSVLCFGQDACCLSTYNWKSLYKDFKLVRVLDLGSAVVDNVPNEIEKLIHLRYLRMNIAPSFRVVPPSICNLWNLLTLDMRETPALDMRETPANCLPKTLWKMQELRHLHISGPTRLQGPSGTDYKALWNLQTLSTVALDEGTLRLIAEAKFPNVTKLGLCSARSSNLGRAKKQTMNSLRHLQYCLQHLHCLQTLKIMGSAIFPYSPELFPPSLSKIALMETKLRPKDMKVLENLPNLQILKLLHGSLEALEIHCYAGGFPQLQVLQMVKLDITQWKLEKDAMQNLRRLVINECVHLTELPDELWHLNTLREVEVFRPSSTLATGLQKLKMKDGRNITVS